MGSAWLELTFSEWRRRSGEYVANLGGICLEAGFLTRLLSFARLSARRRWCLGMRWGFAFLVAVSARAFSLCVSVFLRVVFVRHCCLVIFRFAVCLHWFLVAVFVTSLFSLIVFVWVSFGVAFGVVDVGSCVFHVCGHGH